MNIIRLASALNSLLSKLASVIPAVDENSFEDDQNDYILGAIWYQLDDSREVQNHFEGTDHTMFYRGSFIAYSDKNGMNGHKWSLKKDRSGWSLVEKDGRKVSSTLSTDAFQGKTWEDRAKKLAEHIFNNGLKPLLLSL